MTITILVLSLFYLVSSFILTALYVRFRSNDLLADYYRRHFASFPAFPIAVVAQICLLALQLLARHARAMFELLSGKPTYHRRKVHYYRRRQKLRRRKPLLNRDLDMDTDGAVDSSTRPGLVNDNEAMLPTVPKAASKY